MGTTKTEAERAKTEKKKKKKWTEPQRAVDRSSNQYIYT